MQIVDAQIHTWGTGLPSNLSHWQVTHFTPEEAIVLMDEGGVDAAVIHPPGWDPNSTNMAFEAVRDYPGRFAIMAALGFSLNSLSLFGLVLAVGVVVDDAIVVVENVERHISRGLQPVSKGEGQQPLPTQTNRIRPSLLLCSATATPLGVSHQSRNHKRLASRTGFNPLYFEGPLAA